MSDKIKRSRRDVLYLTALSGVPGLVGLESTDRQNLTNMVESIEAEIDQVEGNQQLASPYDPQIKNIGATYSDALFELQLTANQVDGYQEVGQFQVATGNMSNVYIRRVTPLPVIREGEPTWMDFGREIAVLTANAVIGSASYPGVKELLSLFEEQVLAEDATYVDKVNLFVGKDQTLPERLVNNKSRFLVHLTTKKADDEVEVWKPNMGFFYRPEEQESPTARFAPTPYSMKTAEFCERRGSRSDDRNGGDDGDNRGQGSNRLPKTFTESFERGLNGWQIGLHPNASDRITKGEGEWTDRYGGSVRLSVNGGPSHIGVWKTTTAIPKNTRIEAKYESDNLAGSPGGPRLFFHLPDGGRIRLDFDQGGEGESDGQLSGTVPRDIPSGTDLEFRLGVWPGEIKVYCTEIAAEPP